jgi:hypothetical protein
VPVPVALTFVILLLVATAWSLRVPRPAPQPAGWSSADVHEAPHAKPPATANQPARHQAVSQRQPGDVSAIVLQTEQGRRPVVTDAKYRLNPSPKIYVGVFFNPSSER